MESRLEGPTAEAKGPAAEKLLDEIKTMLQKAEEKAVERAKVADKIIRDHPYPTIGLAFGLGVLIGVLARRR